MAKKIPTSITLDKDVLQQLDRVRQGQSRTRYIEGLLTIAFASSLVTARELAEDRAISFPSDSRRTA